MRVECNSSWIRNQLFLLLFLQLYNFANKDCIYAAWGTEGGGIFTRLRTITIGS